MKAELRRKKWVGGALGALLLISSFCLLPSAFSAITVVQVANIGSPSDDPLLLEPGTLYVPDPAVHPPPWPTVVGTRSGGFTDGGLGNLFQPFTDLANAGYLCLAFECRLAKSAGGQGGLVGDIKYGGGQTTTGHYHQQTDDFKRAVRAMRSNPFGLGYQVTGFVAGLGGSGSAHHAIYCALDGTTGDDKLDAAIAMSPATDFSDRETDVQPQFIGKVTLYGDSTDLAVLLSESPIALPLAAAAPILHYNGDAENMPLSQQTRFRVAMANAGALKYTWTLNTGDCGGLWAGCGSVHAFGIWDFRGPAATTWLNDRVTEWGGSPSPTPAPPARIVIGPRQGNTAPPAVPTGLFYLPSSLTIDPAALNNPNVDGYVINASWHDLEPTDDNYVFDVAESGQSLDSQLAQAEAAPNIKAVRIAIQTGGPNRSTGGHKPDWLYTAIDADGFGGGKYFTFQDASSTVTIPVFWEPTLLAEHAEIAQAVSDHLAGHPLVKIVFVPYCNANSNDWNPGAIDNNIDGIAPTDSTPQTRWLTTLTGSGYATWEAAVKAAGNATFTAYHTAFPDKILTTAIGRAINNTLNPGGASVQGRNIAEDVVNTAAASWPGYIVAQKNNLNGGGVTPAPGGTTAWNDLYRLAVPHAAQMVWHAYADTTCSPDLYGAARMNAGVNSECIDSTIALKQAVDLGITYGTKWQEIYELDILNLGATNADPNPGPVPDVIGYAHTQLYHP